jgi:uncharacterized protein (TIGR02217 family)
MTAFHEVQFPTDISYGSSGGPEYSTDIVITHSGHEQRNVNWSDSRAVYNVAYGVKTATQLTTLISFFRARKGRAYGFRFKDWSDYSATTQSIGTGDAATTTFQLIKRYVSGSETVIRDVNKPVNNSVSIYVNGILQTSGVTVSATTGAVTFTSAPAAAALITANFEFDVPVRFDTDRLSASLDSYGVNSWNNIHLVEVRV